MDISQRQQTANVGLAVPGSKCTAKRPITYLNESVAKSCPNAQSLGLVLDGTVISDELHALVRNGLMLVGDAAPH